MTQISNNASERYVPIETIPETQDVVDQRTQSIQALIKRLRMKCTRARRMGQAQTADRHLSKIAELQRRLVDPERRPRRSRRAVTAVGPQLW